MVQAVNKQQYHAFWIRDLAVITDALDRMGLTATAAQNLPFLGDWQTPEGTFASRPGQGDGSAKRSGCSGSTCGSAATWRSPSSGRRRRPRRQLGDGADGLDPTGLLPASDPKDNEYIAGTSPATSCGASLGSTPRCPSPATPVMPASARGRSRRATR